MAESGTERHNRRSEHSPTANRRLIFMLHQSVVVHVRWRSGFMRRYTIIDFLFLIPTTTTSYSTIFTKGIDGCEGRQQAM